MKNICALFIAILPLTIQAQSPTNNKDLIYDKEELIASNLEGEKQDIKNLSLATEYEGWELIWSEEFDGKVLDQTIWTAETGFQRNRELQWYNGFNNLTCENGVLKIIGKIERLINPNYDQGSSDWRKNRRYAEFTSSSISTKNSNSWLYGRFEIRAKIPTAKGSWPAIWLLGTNKEWPLNGEIDIMEYYLKDNIPSILANAAWGTNERWVAKWNTSIHKFSNFIESDPEWEQKFHLWRMDWDKDYIRIYLDGYLLNEIDLKETINPDGYNPFHHPQYIILNLAIGSNGGIPDKDQFPLIYEIDYIRIYQRNVD